MNWMWDKIQGTSKDNALTESFPCCWKIQCNSIGWQTFEYINVISYVLLPSTVTHINIETFRFRGMFITNSWHVTYTTYNVCTFYAIESEAGDREGTSGTDTIIMMAISNLVCWLRNNNEQWTFFAKFKDGNNSTYVSHRNRYTLSTTIEREKEKTKQQTLVKVKKVFLNSLGMDFIVDIIFVGTFTTRPHACLWGCLCIFVQIFRREQNE